MKRIAAGAFKARCLAVIKEVQATGEPVVITKRGAPVVQVAPVGSGNGDVFGFMAGEFDIVGDIESAVFPEKRRKSETAKLKTQT
jgi:prevent-host-death family protein